MREVAADDRADGQGDQQPDQHQGGHLLGVGVDGGAREQRDVDQRRDQGGPDEEADQHRAPGGGTAQRAGRHQGGPGAAQVQREQAGGHRGADEVPDPAVGEDLHLGVGGREREDGGAGEEGSEP